MNSLAYILIISGIGVGIAYFVSIQVYTTYVMPNEQGSMRELPSTPDPSGNHVSIVMIPKNATLADTKEHLEPKVVNVMIGVNNTVRWVDQYTASPSIPTPNDSSDPDFQRAAQQAKSEQGLDATKGIFEYTFTKAGKFDYHMEPHPWLQGTVIVLPPSGK